MLRAAFKRPLPYGRGSVNPAFVVLQIRDGMKHAVRFVTISPCVGTPLGERRT